MPRDWQKICMGQPSYQGGFAVDSTFVGLNATSHMIEVAIRPTGELWKTDFADENIAETATKLKCMRPKLVVMEGTGSFELPASVALPERA